MKDIDHIKLSLLLIVIFCGIFMGLNYRDIQVLKKETKETDGILINRNMPYHIPTDAIPFEMSSFNDPNSNGMKIKHGMAVIPDRGIIVIRLPDNVRLVVEQEGCQ